MVKLLKFIFFLVIAIGLFLLTPIGQRFWSKTIAIVNPAVAEGQVLGLARQNLSAIGKIISGPAGKNLTASQRSALETAVSAAETHIAEAQQRIDQSNLAASINYLINKVLPYNTPEPVICPTP